MAVCEALPGELVAAKDACLRMQIRTGSALSVPGLPTNKTPVGGLPGTQLGPGPTVEKPVMQRQRLSLSTSTRDIWRDPRPPFIPTLRVCPKIMAGPPKSMRSIHGVCLEDLTGKSAWWLRSWSRKTDRRQAMLGLYMN